MSKSNPAIKPQSEDDAATMAAADALLGGGEPAPTLAKSEGPAEMAKPADQAKADGGQQEPIGKSKDADKDDGMDEDEVKEEEEEEEDEEKSVTEEDLIKAIAIAEGLVTDAEPELDRRATLGEKLSKGEITEEEQDELLGLLSKSTDDSERTFTERAMEDPDISAQHVSDEFDVSAFLARHAAFVAGAMDEFGDKMSKSFGDVRRFQSANARISGALAKSVLEQQQLIKSLSARLEHVERTPQQRVGIPAARALHKSSPVTGGSPGWSRDQIVSGLVAMQRASADGKSPSGRDIAYETAEFESSGQLHPATFNDLSKVLNNS